MQDRRFFSWLHATVVLIKHICRILFCLNCCLLIAAGNCLGLRVTLKLRSELVKKISTQYIVMIAETLKIRPK